MTIEQIEKYVDGSKKVFEEPVKISFKTRNAVEGIFIKAPDFSELKRRNFWRIVSMKNVEDYQKSCDIGLSRIFNGAEFTKLA